MNNDFLTHDIPITGEPLGLLDREWLITNGTGAYAMGTIPGINTRRYHGLFIASTHPPVGRIIALNQMLEQVVFEKDQVELTTCLFRGGDGRMLPTPKGSEMLRRFRRGTSVTWSYSSPRLDFTRQLQLHWKQQATTLRYTVKLKGQTPGNPPRLRLWPMLTLRDFHALLHHDDAGAWAASQSADSVTARRAGAAVTLRCANTRFAAQPTWWYSIQYPLETERGQDDHEDHYLPGFFEAPLKPGQECEFILTVALGEQPAVPADAADSSRIAHLQPIADRLAELKLETGPSAIHHPPSAMLAIATDDFVVDRFFKGERLATIIAGYPWFADWGRDTFIALPGLLLTTGRFDDARSCLRTFANVIRDGVVPNVFSDYDDTAASYNTVDASLWFIRAAMLYLEASGDDASWKDWLCAACVSIIEAYIKGVSVGDNASIRMAGDGLITAGSERTQLTWMDAACGGVVFTPRQGKAVEINALWYHALSGMSDLVAKTGDKDRVQHYTNLTGRIGRSFGKMFWNDEGNCLADHVWTDTQGTEHRDLSLRPNQIFAVSLPHSPIPRTRQTEVLKRVKHKLLTPVGLRTLPENDPAFHAAYTGPQMQRDEAYHQGTIWPWLIGPYAEAVLRVGRFSNEAKAEARSVLAPLVQRMFEAGPGETIGQLHEIHEAREPHRPVGCVAQAWSVAEVVRVLAMTR